MDRSTLSPSLHQFDWSELDEAAAREGAAMVRFRRRLGVEVPSVADAQRLAVARRPDRRHDYDRAAAVEAFDRLFRGERVKSERPGASTERSRRFRQRQRERAAACQAQNS